MATGYGLNGPGIESRCRRDFPHLSRPALGPPSLLYNGYRVFPGGKERPVRDADPSPPSIAVGDERVELYLYSPYGPYGLYRASVPVQGCTLPFFFSQYNTSPFKRCTIFHFSHTVYLYVLYVSRNKQRISPYATLDDYFYNRDRKCLLRGTNCGIKRNGVCFVLKGV